MARRDLTGAVDFGHLESFAAGDTSLIEEVLGMFREQADLWVRLLDPDGPPDGWRDAAHTLKGAALGVGAFQLANTCDAAEIAFEADPGGKSVLLENIRDALNAAVSDIAAYTHEQALKSLKG